MPTSFSKFSSLSRGFPLVVAALLMVACSHKDVVGPGGGGGGGAIVFFNWLPALLADQSSAQPNHEIMQFMDNPANWSDTAAMQAIVNRLGNAPAQYAQNANIQPGDAPILEAIFVYIQEMERFLAGDLNYNPPRLTRSQE